LQFLGYAVVSLRLINRYRRAASNLFSNSIDTNLNWLYSTIVFFIVLTVITVINGILAQTAFAHYYLLAFNLAVLALFIFVVRVLMRALRRAVVPVFGQDTGSTPVRAEPKDRAEKEKIAGMVLAHLKKEHPYREPELTLDQLAAQLSIKPKLLSQSINEILGQNFFDLVNRHRIDEARRLLTHPEDEKITILEVLYEVGFNSKSSFNTLFKKYTGLTPSEFRKNQSR